MERLRELLLARGAALVGFADLSELYPEVRYYMPRGISIAVAIDPQIIADLAAGPTPEYCREYTRVNRQLNDLAALAADYLQGLGYRVKTIESTVAYVDANTCSAPFQHKTVATRAGLGWIGKGALLITRDYGSAIRLSSVLTDAPLPVGRPTNHSNCGDCRTCADACPGAAIKGVNWQVGMFRDELYNAFACRETAINLARRVGVDRTICGICINACPWTRQYLARALTSAETAE
jgi:epoxyqueuosine reductase QueG